MTRPTLVLFLKEPVPGQVKTRLGHEIGMAASAQWFRKQTAVLVRRLSTNRRWRTVLAVSPDHAGLNSRTWPPDLPRWPQGRGDLGARMSRALLAFGPGPKIVVGGDIPGIRPTHIAHAFATLGTHDAVFGPVPDGGYWLVGIKGTRPLPRGFMKGVRWSTSHALADTLATAPPDWRIAMTDTMQDIDTYADLLAMRAGSLRLLQRP